MKIDLIVANGLGRTPENLLAKDYAARASAIGARLALGPVGIVEVESRKANREAEGEALLSAAAGARLILCDERGKAYSSRAFSDRLCHWRDAGERRLAFIVGGADGHGDALRAAAVETLAFGPQTWPHALVRVMLAEQVYRAISIAAGTPYHRD